MVADVDNEILKKVAKLGVLARKQGTIKLDFNRLLTDRSYANQLLSELEGSNDEDLVLLCLSLKVDFGILPATFETRSVKFAEVSPTRYVYSPRG
jgi:hypothetical protein